MKHWLPHPLLTPALAAIWLLLNNSLAPGHVVLGLFLGWMIPRLTLAFWPDRLQVQAPWVVVRFALFLLREIVVANFAVLRLVIAGPRALRPAFVIVPLDLRHEVAISLLVNAICLTPGTVSARLSADRRQLLVHVLDCADAAQLVTSLKADFEAPLQRIFAADAPCRKDEVPPC